MRTHAAGSRHGPDDDGSDREDLERVDPEQDVEGQHGERQVDPDAPARTLVDPDAPAVEPNEPG
jgi:hypothetical protein